MEGMVQFLLGGDAWAAAALREYVFHIVPMANPDGVFNGLGRLTAPRGADVVWATTDADGAHGAVQQAVDRVKPKLWIDLHNWQNKHVDGLLGLDPEIREHFLHYMPDQWEFGKHWSIREPSPIPETPPANGFRRVDTISLGIEGSLANIEKLYRSLSTFPRIATIEGLSLAGEGDTIQAQLDMTIYLLVEVPSPEAMGVAGVGMAASLLPIGRRPPPPE